MLFQAGKEHTYGSPPPPHQVRHLCYFKQVKNILRAHPPPPPPPPPPDEAFGSNFKQIKNTHRAHPPRWGACHYFRQAKNTLATYGGFEFRSLCQFYFQKATIFIQPIACRNPIVQETTLEEFYSLCRQCSPSMCCFSGATVIVFCIGSSWQARGAQEEGLNIRHATRACDSRFWWGQWAVIIQIKHFEWF